MVAASATPSATLMAGSRNARKTVSASMRRMRFRLSSCATLVLRRCIAFAGRHCPKIEKPTGSKIVAEPEHLGIIPPELTVQAIAEPHPFLLELFGKPRPPTQLDEARISNLQTAKQMPIGTQPIGRDVGVSPIVLGTRNAEAIT